MSSEERWSVSGVLLAAAVVALYLTFDVPYLLFMKKAIEQSIDSKIDLLHVSVAGLLIIICVMFAILVVFNNRPTTQLGHCRPKRIFPFIFIGFLILLHFVLTVVVSAKVSDQEKARLREYVPNYWNYHTDSINQRYVDDIQISLSCCGISSVDDYGTMNIPPSCCDNKGCDKERAHEMGCYKKISTLLITCSISGATRRYPHYSSRVLFQVLQEDIHTTDHPNYPPHID
ncbi:CD63 antigen-like [Bolinopsis microptera]|uniref:CD63 antigen-like n=1 Tax=Bolinopsis microptera TaxID=2820187 RepID=UPI003078BDAD